MSTDGEPVISTRTISGGERVTQEGVILPLDVRQRMFSDPPDDGLVYVYIEDGGAAGLIGVPPEGVRWEREA